MAEITLKINGEVQVFDADPQSNLLWFLRDEVGLTGAKYSCGIAVCGSCTIHLNGKPIRSCITTLAAANDGEIVTIEGLKRKDLHPVQKAWIEEQVPQCGYCQSGQIMQAVALLEENPNPSREEIISYMKDNLCRCGTYNRIIKAIEKAAQNL